MKNVLMIVVSVLVGYGFAYLSASKKWAPFGKMQGQETNYSKTLEGNGSDSGVVLAMEVSNEEMKAMSDNYAAWLTELNAKVAKGSTQGNEVGQPVIRGGRISASLLDRLAKNKNDVYYLFGRKINSNLVYMILSEPATMSTNATIPGDNYIVADSATMCPCVCPEKLMDLPTYCNNLPPITPGSEPQPTP